MTRPHPNAPRRDLASMLEVNDNEPASFGIQLQELIGPRKPCPFCGSNDPELNCWDEYVVCKGCDASAPAMRWQFRAPQP